jgi:hypothetical protein
MLMSDKQINENNLISISEESFMKILFTDCWVGCYVGEGKYEGGCCPDLLITNVPDNLEDSDVFEYYLMGLCSGFCDHDKIEYTSKVIKRRPTKRVPVKITSLEELENCYKEFIELDYNDLEEWIFD